MHGHDMKKIGSTLERLHSVSQKNQTTLLYAELSYSCIKLLDNYGS